MKLINQLVVLVLLQTLITTQAISGQLNCLFEDDVDSYPAVNGMNAAELAGWSHDSDRGIDSWRVLPGAGVSLSNAFSVAEESEISLLGVTDSYLITPELFLSGQFYLEFMHKYDFEADSSFYDGGQLQITRNNGFSWSDLNPHILTGGYNEIISSAFGSPIGGEEAWAGEQQIFGLVQVDLADYMGEYVKIRWRFVSGFDSIAQLGWRIDNIRVVDSIGLGDVIFFSQFEITDLDLCY